MKRASVPMKFTCAVCETTDAWKAGWQYFQMFDGILVVCSDACADAQSDKWASGDLSYEVYRPQRECPECHQYSVFDSGICGNGRCPNEGEAVLGARTPQAANIEEERR